MQAKVADDKSFADDNFEKDDTLKNNSVERKQSSRHYVAPPEREGL